jgi:hypothetical protein
MGATEFGAKVGGSFFAVGEAGNDPRGEGIVLNHLLLLSIILLSLTEFIMACLIQI